MRLFFLNLEILIQIQLNLQISGNPQNFDSPNSPINVNRPINLHITHLRCDDVDDEYDELVVVVVVAEVVDAPTGIDAVRAYDDDASPSLRRPLRDSGR